MELRYTGSQPMILICTGLAMIKKNVGKFEKIQQKLLCYCNGKMQ